MRCVIRKNRTATDANGDYKFVMKFYDDEGNFLHNFIWKKQCEPEDNSLDESDFQEFLDDVLRMQADMFNIEVSAITVTEETV